MIKLLYITNQICGSGGLERVLSIKASYLANKFNYKVHILTLNQVNEPLFYEFSELIEHHNIKATGNKLQYFLSYKKGLQEIVKKVQPDVISVCDDGLKGFFVPWFIKKPCPMVYERHVSKNIERKKDEINPLKKIVTKCKFILMQLAAKKYNNFIVLTKGNVAEWKLNNLKVISNPLSFLPNVHSSLENKKIIAVGKHSYQKGYDRLLKIWQQVVLKHSDWKLEIYGKIEVDLKLSQLAKELGIEKSVTFFPPEKNIGEKYRNSSIYVMSSRYEGFGMVLIEAMAYGVPCISFDCPHGPSDIIKNNEDGFIIENGNIEGFAIKLIELISDFELRKKMGKIAKQNVLRFDPKVIVPQWNELFKKLVKS